jgi:hypothetical protein
MEVRAESIVVSIEYLSTNLWGIVAPTFSVRLANLRDTPLI